MKKVAIAIVIIALIIIGVLALGGSNNNSIHNQTTRSNQNSNQNTNGTRRSDQTNAQTVATDKVGIKDMAFVPASLTVKKGTSVTWTNNDAISHTVTETDGKTGPTSQPLSKGQTYSFTYIETGTFRYHCSIHPNMTGTVTVTE